ncbi:uncharacterized protein LOC127247148 [Andrographis paniculata]|uniref:uncharacterized protein LOC127247148 n=1 Tax=Andrographis paniculata TaxID=175694 RepID=UPI0021E8E638|nr:uncharacterized protein LOC127247148 [Andrographis paniculata]XP_051124840.1 uncharacterized protein LOC127247148 [Andrographis paniculata]
MLKAVCGRHLDAHVKIRSPGRWTPNPSDSFAFSLTPFFRRRKFSFSAQSVEEIEINSRENAQPLSAFFTGEVGLSKKTGETAVKLEGDCAKLKGNSSVKIGPRQSLSALFSKGKKEKEKEKEKEVKFVDPVVHSLVSPDMQLFARHLYLRGYLKGANFIGKQGFDSTIFQDNYAIGFLKYAAVNFGEDHAEIAKWLSASELKKIALFGCPTLYRKNVNAAKYLRLFFNIEEHEVCQKCTLRNTCKHADKKPRGDSSKFNLATVNRILTAYALGPIPQELVVSKEIRESISRLLKEIINLSQKDHEGAR